jgi:hypothetical protein
MLLMLGISYLESLRWHGIFTVATAIIDFTTITGNTASSLDNDVDGTITREIGCRRRLWNSRFDSRSSRARPRVATSRPDGVAKFESARIP